MTSGESVRQEDCVSFYFQKQKQYFEPGLIVTLFEIREWIDGLLYMRRKCVILQEIAVSP
jgi:hypothetical protein